MSHKVFSKKFNSDLIRSASQSPRLRYHHNIHATFDDPVQRIVIALCQGTYIPPHYHNLSHQWEFFHVVEGCVDLLIFSDSGVVTNITSIGPDKKQYAVEIPPFLCHTLICNSKQAIIYEWKQGPFDLIHAKVIPSWSLPESTDNYDRERIIKMISSLKVGDCFNSFLHE